MFNNLKKTKNENKCNYIIPIDDGNDFHRFM